MRLELAEPPGLPAGGEVKTKNKHRSQVAALPFRVRQGVPEVMLITSRETGRWVVPKGWPQKGRAPHAVAAREAYEEAGLVGFIEKRRVGTYRYAKRLSLEFDGRLQSQRLPTLRGG